MKMAHNCKKQNPRNSKIQKQNFGNVRPPEPIYAQRITSVSLTYLYCSYGCIPLGEAIRKIVRFHYRWTH